MLLHLLHLVHLLLLLLYLFRHISTARNCGLPDPQPP